MSPAPETPLPTLHVQDHGRVRCLTMDHPSARNALVPEISRPLSEQVLAAADNPGIGALVLTGAGEHFCSGGDVRSLARQQAAAPASQVQRIGVLNELVRVMRQSPLPIIAAVEGYAAGAGFSLALACDLTVASREARFLMAYVRLGLTPDGGGSHHLARALPAPQAYAALALGEPLDAATMHRAGLVHSLTPKGEALAHALALAARLAEGPRDALADIKRLVVESALGGLAQQLEDERRTFVRHLHADPARRAVQAFLDRSGKGRG